LQTPPWKREPARAALSKRCPVRDGRALPKQPLDRAPDVSPSGAPIRVASSRTRVRFRVLLAPGERLRARPSPRRLASRGFTGQGPRRLSPSRRLSSRLLANESFAPTRSARTPPVASSLRSLAGGQRRCGVLVGGWPHTSSPRQPAHAGQRRRPAFAGPSHRAAGRACQLFPCDPLTWSRRRQGRLPRSSAKRSAIRCARGAFRRWISLPWTAV